MANVKISDLPVATSVGVSDSFPLVQGGTTKQAAQSDILTTLGNMTAAKFVPTGGTATGNGMYLPAANTLAWSTNGADVMRLDASGNLGIGVTPSGAKLDLASSSATYQIIRSSATYASSLSLAGNGASPFSASFDIQHLGTGDAQIILRTTNAISFGTNNTERARIASDGKVGIGTNNPASSLDVNGGIRAAQGVPASGDASNVGYSFGADGDTGLFSPTTGGAASGVLLFIANGTEVARFDSGFITSVTSTAPTLSTNSTMSFELTSNTSLKIVVRGTDGVTRSVSLTLS